jgi:hypothetical protein
MHLRKNSNIVLKGNYDYFSDRNNCALVALSCITGLPYDFSYELAKLAGRNKMGVNSRVFLETFNELGLPMRFTPISIFRKVGKKWTQFRLASFCNHHSKGLYYVRFSGHALAVINGEVHELRGSRARCLVASAWRLEGGEGRRGTERDGEGRRGMERFNG